MTVKIHPSVDSGVKPGTKDFAGGTLVCKCTTNPVKVELKAPIAHNHVCGCTQCWRPAGITFAMVAVVARDKLSVTANADKLKVVDCDSWISAVVGKVPTLEHDIRPYWPLTVP